MAYRRPGVTVTQEFVNLVPALAAFQLPSVVVGPAYQLVTSDLLGTYSAVQRLYAYASLMGGAIIDLDKPASDELFPATKLPVAVTLRSAFIGIVPSSATGAVTGTSFTDAASGVFADVLPGDIVTISPATAGTIVAARTDGVSTDTTGQRNRLTGSGDVFSKVKVGDSVVVTGGANTVTGTYTVSIKVNANLLVLSANVNDGVGAATNVAYSITGDRGAANAGDYRVRTVTDANTLVLESPVIDSPEAPLSYIVKRAVSSIALARVDLVSENGFIAEESGITLPATLTYQGFPILSGTVYADYRAIRIDKASETVSYSNSTAVTSAFGAGQVTPQNPLAYGLFYALQNTVTPVNGLGLDQYAASNEALSYTAAADVLKRVDMYAIALLSQNPVVHTLFKNHVVQMSDPSRGLERVAIFNSKLISLITLQEESTTVTTVNGSRTIVSTQIDGAANISTPAKLSDSTADQFLSVAKGDTVVITSGTGVTPGAYTVSSKIDSNNLTLSSNFVTSGTPSDIQYYIYRLDGISADGLKLYDRNALFLTNGVAAGHYIRILSGSLAGRYRVASVSSEKEVVLASALLGVTSLQTAINYQADRDMTRDEQADSIKGYSESFASRRAVHCWPDMLQSPLGQTIITVPGFYGCCAIAALTSGLPTQQGLTNLSVSGFLGLSHSSRYFSEEQLDTIASGGTLIFAQDGPGQVLYIRHQLTTDRSSIKFQEYSVTKNVDFLAKFLRTTYQPFSGQWNIVDTTMDVLKTTGNAAVNFLRDKTKVPRFGGVIRGGSLVSMTESTDAIDSVIGVFAFNIPIPLNNIFITIQV